MSETAKVTDILDTLDDLADSEDDVTIGDVLEALGGRGFGPLILLPALLVITPLGGIPFVPTTMALVIGLIAGQVIFQRDHLWLPGFLRDRGVQDEKVKKSTAKLRGLARWLDDHMGDRLEMLTASPMPSVTAGVVVLLCMLVPPSEMIPFAAIVPMGAIALLALALTLRDGLVMLAGLIGAAAALFTLWGWFI